MSVCKYSQPGKGGTCRLGMSICPDGQGHSDCGTYTEEAYENVVSFDVERLLELVALSAAETEGYLHQLKEYTAAVEGHVNTDAVSNMLTIISSCVNANTKAGELENEATAAQELAQRFSWKG